MKRMLIPFALFTGAVSASAQVTMIGDRWTAGLILRLVEAAERNDTKTFNRMVGQTYRTRGRKPPSIDDVNRRDEGCSLKAIDARSKIVPEAVWNCPANNSKRNIERMFLVDRGIVASMWNEWGSGIT